MVWRSLLADIPGFADDPSDTLFSYRLSYAFHSTEHYLSRYRNNPKFIEMVESSLRKNCPGSSPLALFLIRDGQKACLPDALHRAMKVLPHPDAFADDVVASIQLVHRYGTDDQRRRVIILATKWKAINPDYANYLQMQLMH